MSDIKKIDLADVLIEKAINERHTTMDLGCCGLNEIPEKVFKIEWLEELNLGNYIWQEETRKWEKSKNNGPLNKLATIPFELSQLKRLKVLRLSGYNSKYRERCWKIEKIPAGILPTSLLYLDVSYNILTELSGLVNLINLKFLFLASNRIVYSGHTDPPFRPYRPPSFEGAF